MTMAQGSVTQNITAGRWFKLNKRFFFWVRETCRPRANTNFSFELTDCIFYHRTDSRPSQQWHPHSTGIAAQNRRAGQEQEW